MHTKPQSCHECICTVATVVQLQPGICDIFPNSGMEERLESLPYLLNCGKLAFCFAATTKMRVPEHRKVCDPLCGYGVQPIQQCTCLSHQHHLCSFSSWQNPGSTMLLLRQNLTVQYKLSAMDRGWLEQAQLSWHH